MKTLPKNLKNKTVLLRVDINSDAVNGKIQKSERIKPVAQTIELLKQKKAKIVVLAHQGNPKKSDFKSLKEHAKFLNKHTKIKFISETITKKAKQEIRALKPGQALLLENIRFIPDEFYPGKKNNKIITSLVPLADLYVNDAFSVCHRNQTSMTGLPRHLPAYVGPLLAEELAALNRLKTKNLVFLLSGAKPEENLKLLKKGRKILAGGIFGQMCLMSRGHILGEANNKVNKKLALDYEKALPKLKNKTKNLNLVLPVDYAVEVKGKRKELPLSCFPTNYIIYDIGSKTIELFKKHLKRAKAVYVKGPVGFCGKKQFCKGTFEILRAIANSKAASILGGGHTVDALKKSKIPRSKFNHISLSGGALLRSLAGETLPALEALK